MHECLTQCAVEFRLKVVAWGPVDLEAWGLDTCRWPEGRLERGIGTHHGLRAWGLRTGGGVSQCQAFGCIWKTTLTFSRTSASGRGSISNAPCMTPVTKSKEKARGESSARRPRRRMESGQWRSLSPSLTTTWSGGWQKVEEGTRPGNFGSTSALVTCQTVARRKGNLRRNSTPTTSGPWTPATWWTFVLHGSSLSLPRRTLQMKWLSWRVTGGAPRGGRKKGAKPGQSNRGDLDWSMSDHESPPDLPAGEDDGLRRRLADLKRQTAGEPAGHRGDPGGKHKDRKRDKSPSKHKRRSRDRRRGGSPEKAKDQPLWFGKRVSPSPCGEASSESTRARSTRKDKKKQVRSRSPSSEKKKKKKRAKKDHQADRGPYGVGQRRRYDGKSSGDLSTEDETGQPDDQVFRAGPSSTSKHLQLQEYAEKRPGRLTARLLNKMRDILAREEGPMHQGAGTNLTPSAASSYFLTVIVPQYKERLTLRTSRELRTTAKALDLYWPKGGPIERETCCRRGTKHWSFTWRIRRGPGHSSWSWFRPRARHSSKKTRCWWRRKSRLWSRECGRLSEPPSGELPARET